MLLQTNQMLPSVVGGDAFGITPCIACIGDCDRPVVGDPIGGTVEVVGHRGKDGLERRGRWLEKIERVNVLPQGRMARDVEDRLQCVRRGRPSGREWLQRRGWSTLRLKLLELTTQTERMLARSRSLAAECARACLGKVTGAGAGPSERLRRLDTVAKALVRP